jgi:hypothetical protein
MKYSTFLLVLTAVAGAGDKDAVGAAAETASWPRNCTNAASR